MNIDFKTIFYEEGIDRHPQYQVIAQDVLNKFPKAMIKRVESHNRIPELIEMDPEQWIKSKRDYLVLGVKKGLTHQPNDQSADFIAASHTTGCVASCQYCYVARNTGGTNVAKVYVNIDDIAASIRRHQAKRGPKPEPNQQDVKYWVYDIGCNNDNSLDALYSDNPKKLIEAFSGMEYAKASFATKFVNEEAWLSVDPKGKTRIREVIFLTHSQKLHELNLNWNPKGEEFLVGQVKQRKKYNKPDVLVYDYPTKKKLVAEFSDALKTYVPYCDIRYIF